mmetsp:Transcript_95669/g.164985  ORF Transcript_95669/g.164985 Transcript_95669/m.164985 type:complete len:84 (-) Transcript_95669:95-346(-)
MGCKRCSVDCTPAISFVSLIYHFDMATPDHFEGGVRAYACAQALVSGWMVGFSGNGCSPDIPVEVKTTRFLCLQPHLLSDPLL